MTRLTPISRRELVQRLRELGFEGPFTGGRHELMVGRILRQAGIEREEWLS